MKVLIDTSGWYAFFVSSDRFHVRAKEFFEFKPTTATNSIVFEETIALLHARYGKKIAVQAGKMILSVCKDDFWYIDRQWYEEIFRFYAESKPAIDLVDESIIWQSQQLGVPIFTFDAHFRTMKVQLVQ